MIKAGIFQGDLIIVDGSLKPKDKKVVIALYDGSIVLRRLRNLKGKTYLMPERNEYRPVIIFEEMNIEILGVATHVIHPL